MAFDLPDVSDAGGAVTAAQLARRNACILDHIKNKDYSIQWAHLDIPGPPAIRLTVFADALMIGGVRVNVSAQLLQIIADLLGCMMLTPRICDLMYLAAKASGPVLLPSPQPITSTTKAMIAHSARVDGYLASVRDKLPMTPDGGAPLVQTVGKQWVVANELQQKKVGTAENYGWQFPGSSFGGSKFESSVTPPLRCIQGQGWAHDITHVDYSQIAQLVWARCTVDGEEKSLPEVLATDPQVAKLLNHNGLLKVTRQPGVEKMSQADDPAANAFKSAALIAGGAAMGTVIAPGVGTLLGGAAGVAADAVRKQYGF